MSDRVGTQIIGFLTHRLIYEIVLFLVILMKNNEFLPLCFLFCVSYFAEYTMFCYERGIERCAYANGTTGHWRNSHAEDGDFGHFGPFILLVDSKRQCPVMTHTQNSIAKG